nr:hypothetical protein [uncultured Halomonas sp.]
MAQKSIPIDRHVLRRIKEIVYLRGSNTQTLTSAVIDAFIDDMNGCQAYALSRYDTAPHCLSRDLANTSGFSVCPSTYQRLYAFAQAHDLRKGRLAHVILNAFLEDACGHKETIIHRVAGPCLVLSDGDASARRGRSHSVLIPEYLRGQLSEVSEQCSDTPTVIGSVAINLLRQASPLQQSHQIALHGASHEAPTKPKSTLNIQAHARADVDVMALAHNVPRTEVAQCALLAFFDLTPDAQQQAVEAFRECERQSVRTHIAVGDYRRMEMYAWSQGFTMREFFGAISGMLPPHPQLKVME